MAAGGATTVTRPGPVAARPNPLKSCAPFVRTRVPGPKVLLTFDDGPHPAFTPGVAARLEDFGATAVFMTLGRSAVRFPRLVGALVAAGHGVGNHSFDHTGGYRDFRRGDAALRRLGVSPRFVRPPFGTFTPGLFAAAWRCGTPILTWSLDSDDWRCRNAGDADRVAQTTAARAEPGDVILLHDAHPFIGRVLDSLLPQLAGRGLL